MSEAGGILGSASSVRRASSATVGEPDGMSAFVEDVVALGPRRPVGHTRSDDPRPLGASMGLSMSARLDSSA
jgi:hypothetical protein